ncbi:MAG: glucosaminidase domain-containing protein [Muribaculaceae bacterium]|nr:glucosaminidase domain-containing protein [Muribaculaceae bacterium]
MQKRNFLLVLILFIVSSLKADVYQEYIDTYSVMAVKQQEEYRIPASITLAQGLLESSAGRSRLAREGNNHFGIKCHSDWNGDTMLRDDDAPDECFRVYDSPEESYRDHSKFLRRDRYRPLFDLEITDYQGWAKGLRKCGYATDPNYADKLMAIIERYGLYGFDKPGEIEQTVMFIRETLSAKHRVQKSNGLHYVVAFPGDTYKSIAKEFQIKEKKLREFNDALKENGIKEWEEVYLEPKREYSAGDVAKVTIGEGENMRSISQRYGIKLTKLKELNKKAKDKEGTVLKLK